MFGQRLRLARKRAGLSLRSLAERMDPKVTAQAISKYEAGKMMPSSAVLVGLGEALDVSLDFLMSARIDVLDGLGIPQGLGHFRPRPCPGRSRPDRQHRAVSEDRGGSRHSAGGRLLRALPLRLRRHRSPDRRPCRSAPRDMGPGHGSSAQPVRPPGGKGDQGGRSRPPRAHQRPGVPGHATGEGRRRCGSGIQADKTWNANASPWPTNSPTRSSGQPETPPSSWRRQ